MQLTAGSTVQHSHTSTHYKSIQRLDAIYVFICASHAFSGSGKMGAQVFRSTSSACLSHDVIALVLAPHIFTPPAVGNLKH